MPPNPSPADPPEILIESAFGFRTRKPFVVLRWGEMRGQLTPAAARQHALRIMEAADAAESDALLVRFLQQRVGIQEDEKAIAILSDFRAMRGQLDDEDKSND